MLFHCLRVETARATQSCHNLLMGCLVVFLVLNLFGRLCGERRVLVERPTASITSRWVATTEAFVGRLGSTRIDPLVVENIVWKSGGVNWGKTSCLCINAELRKRGRESKDSKRKFVSCREEQMWVVRCAALTATTVVDKKTPWKTKLDTW